MKVKIHLFNWWKSIHLSWKVKERSLIFYSYWLMTLIFPSIHFFIHLYVLWHAGNGSLCSMPGVIVVNEAVSTLPRLHWNGKERGSEQMESKRYQGNSSVLDRGNMVWGRKDRKPVLMDNSRRVDSSGGIAFETPWNSPLTTSIGIAKPKTH